MSSAPLLQLSNLTLGYGGDPLLDDLTLTIQPGDRLALVGRNGSGKSTLLKVMAGLVQPDAGQCIAAPGASVGYMHQEPDLSAFQTLGDFAISELEPDQSYLVDRAAEGLGFDPETRTDVASGGERRRAALAKLMAEAPDLMLLDEPTNHLDIQAIGWLENQLVATRQSFVTISHDRAFLNKVSRATLWIDRGTVRRMQGDHAGFEVWRDKVWEEEDLARHKLNRKIKAEARWAVEGISARRKRNMGRVRALQALRAERAGQIRRQGTADLAFESGRESGRKVIEAERISKAFDGRTLIRNLSMTIQRGDRVAIVGPNGAGKTTLINMLLGKADPDSGIVKPGTNLEVAVFDQTRAVFDADLSLWDNLVADPDLGSAGKADQILVRGTPKHVVGYLKDFLFDEAQARAPVRSLSGGERARLLLARLMAKPSNLLVLDEPTNDLDLETLDLLQEILSDYDGTVLLVSHDRDFIDRVATRTVFLDGDGTATSYAGGWSDALAQRGYAFREPEIELAKPRKEKANTPQQRSAKSVGLSFTEKHRLAELPAEIDRLTAEIGKLETLLADPDLFTTNPLKFRKATEALVARQTALDTAETEWLTLEERAGS